MSDNNHNDNEILSYIDNHGIVHKDYTPTRKNQKKKSSFEKRGKRIRKVLDLHGRYHDEVAPLVREAFHECKSRGIDTILIIHGVLHLLGYKHDKPEPKRLMSTREKEILSHIEKSK